MSLFSQVKNKIFPSQFPMVGVDISEASITLLQLEPGADKPSIKNAARLELKPGLMVKGKIKDLDYLADILSKAYIQAKPAFSSQYCLLSLPDRYTYFVNLSVGILATEQEILEQAQAELPLNLKQCYYDYQVVERQDKYEQIFFVAAEKELVSQYLQIFDKTSLHLAVIDFESACLARALVTNTSTPTLIVDIGAESTDIVLLDKKGFRDQTNIRLGGRTLTAAFVESLKIDLAEAENLKRVQGLNFKDKNIITILQSNLNSVVSEIKRMQKNYKDLAEQKIMTIVLAGGSSLLPGLKDFFSANFSDVQVEMGQFDQKIEIESKTLKGDRILYSNVLGLALRGLNKDNLKKGINLIK